MKRSGWFPIISGRNWFAVLLLVAVLFPCHAETAYYRSNEVGMAFEMIGTFRLEEFPYVLEIQSERDIEIRTLFHEGKQEKRWEREFRGKKLANQTEYDGNGLPVRSERYDAQGLLKEELFFTEGSVEERKVHHYRNGIVVRTQVYNVQDELLYTERYIRGSDGRLVRTQREFGTGENESSSYLFSGNSLREEWHGNSTKGMLYRYNRAGALYAKETWRNGKLAAKESFTFEDGRIAASFFLDYERGSTLSRRYTMEGMISYEREEGKAGLVQEVLFGYEEGKLKEKIVRKPGLRDQYSYAYDEKGKRTEERYSQNGVLKSVTRYTAENAYYQELFKDGEVFLRVFFEKDTKVKEEYVRGGQVFRVREAGKP